MNGPYLGLYSWDRRAGWESPAQPETGVQEVPRAEDWGKGWGRTQKDITLVLATGE